MSLISQQLILIYTYNNSNRELPSTHISLIHECSLSRFGDQLFNKLYPGDGVTSKSVALKEYQEAVEFGQQRGPCGQRFASCRAGAEEMMNIITNSL